MKKQLLTLLFLSAIIPAFAQTYATPELKKQEEKHKAEKMEWIKNNPEAYREQCKNIGEDLKDLSDVGWEGNPAEGGEISTSSAQINGYPIPPSPEYRTNTLSVDIKDTALYKQVSVKAVDIENKNTKEQMAGYEQEAKDEFNSYNILIDWNKKLWYSIPRDSNFQQITKKINIDINTLESIDCNGCRDTKFIITEQSASKLVFQIESKEDGENFMYQFEFKK